MATSQTEKPAAHGVRALFNAATAPRNKSRDLEDIGKVNWALLPLLFLAFAAALWVGVQAGSVGAIFLWSVACVAAGATVGFLFGIPRAGPVERLAAATVAAGTQAAQGPAGTAAAAVPRAGPTPTSRKSRIG